MILSEGGDITGKMCYQLGSRPCPYINTIPCHCFLPPRHSNFTSPRHLSLLARSKMEINLSRFSEIVVKIVYFAWLFCVSCPPPSFCICLNFTPLNPTYHISCWLFPSVDSGHPFLDNSILHCPSQRETIKTTRKVTSDHRTRSVSH